MSIQSVLLPLFVEVALTFVLMVWMGIARRGALNSGAVRVEQIALREPAWPRPVMQIANSFSNQFELPVLFYVLTILAMITRHADVAFVVLAWVFVIFRILQAAAHTTTNNVQHRSVAYSVSAIVLMIMWAVFAVRILLGLS